jgi:hypothetical protein
MDEERTGAPSWFWAAYLCVAAVAVGYWIYKDQQPHQPLQMFGDDPNREIRRQYERMAMEEAMRKIEADRE